LAIRQGLINFYVSGSGYLSMHILQSDISVIQS
jgi:hypothetical protein